MHGGAKLTSWRGPHVALPYSREVPHCGSYAIHAEYDRAYVARVDDQPSDREKPRKLLFAKSMYEDPISVGWNDSLLQVFKAKDEPNPFGLKKPLPKKPDKSAPAPATVVFQGIAAADLKGFCPGGF